MFGWKLSLKYIYKIPHVLEVCQDISPKKSWGLWSFFLVDLSPHFGVFYASSWKELTREQHIAVIYLVDFSHLSQCRYLKEGCWRTKIELYCLSSASEIMGWENSNATALSPTMYHYSIQSWSQETPFEDWVFTAEETVNSVYFNMQSHFQFIYFQ